jgi:orotidine-5'-phosphate decarboxylase
MRVEPFPDRLARACREKGTSVCVGIDPRVRMLPQEFRPNHDSPRAQAEAVAGWTRALLDVVAPLVPVVKPQVAFFEALGAAGWAAYHETVIAARARGLVVVADVKRGDVGSTAEAYAEAHLELVGADAVTLSPYLGRDSLEPFLVHCRLRGKGVFVLVKTSNPGGAELQDLDAGGEPFHLRVADLVDELSRDAALVGDCGMSAVGAVTGATYPAELALLRERMPLAPFLVPGYGAQGGTAQDCAAAFRADGLGAVVNSSRGLTFAFRSGDHAERFGDQGWRASVTAAVVAMRDALAAAVPAHGP